MKQWKSYTTQLRKKKANSGRNVCHFYYSHFSKATTQKATQHSVPKCIGIMHATGGTLPGVGLHGATYLDMTASLQASDVRLAVFICPGSDKICGTTLRKAVATEIKKTEITIRKVFEASCTAWNRGDLDGYLASYWDSDKTIWVSNGSLTRGNKAIAAAYKARFSTPAEMGKLTLLELEIDVLTSEDAIALGRWMLAIDNESSKGFFTVQLRKIEGAWFFVSDHSSTSV